MPCVTYTFVMEYDLDLLFENQQTGEPIDQATAEEYAACTFADDVAEMACEHNKYIVQDCDIQWSQYELDVMAATQLPPVPPITDEDIAWEDAKDA